MKKKLPFMILCGAFVIVCIVTAFVFFTKDTKKEPEELQTKEPSQNEETMKEPQMLNLSNLTDLPVITDCTKFTPVTEDQSYNPETDMPQGRASGCNLLDMGDIVYILEDSWRLYNGALFAFQKATGRAGIACDKPDCLHDTKTVEGDCQANLHMLGLGVSNLQYYKGDFYYILGGTMLYKMSPNRETKYKYASLLGEKGFGTQSCQIHRGYIYFCASREGIYKMPVDNPSYKELIIRIPDNGNSSVGLKAYGSYLYFTIFDSEEKLYAVARYNTEADQIEQMMNLEYMDGYIWHIMIHNEKIYYTEARQNEKQPDFYDSGSVYEYDIASAKNTIFLEAGNNMSLYFMYGDSDYLYIRKVIEKEKDYYENSSGKDISMYMPEYDISYLAYTWDGEIAGKVLDIFPDDKIKDEQTKIGIQKELIGSDSDRIYYFNEKSEYQLDTTVEENTHWVGTGKNGKIIISYINKSELSLETDAPEYIAMEMPVEEEYDEKYY